jgi:hypothetical protein
MRSSTTLGVAEEPAAEVSTAVVLEAAVVAVVLVLEVVLAVAVEVSATCLSI